jgi:hypothetical protein
MIVGIRAFPAFRRTTLSWALGPGELNEVVEDTKKAASLDGDLRPLWIDQNCGHVLGLRRRVPNSYRRRDNRLFARTRFLKTIRALPATACGLRPTVVAAIWASPAATISGCIPLRRGRPTRRDAACVMR